MADETKPPRRGPSDATDYSSTQAPETRKESEEEHGHPRDPRAQPGGARPAQADPGMSALDREDTISGGQSTGQEDYGQPAKKRPV